MRASIVTASPKPTSQTPKRTTAARTSSKGPGRSSSESSTSRRWEKASSEAKGPIQRSMLSSKNSGRSCLCLVLVLVWLIGLVG